MEGIKREADRQQPFVYKVCIDCGQRVLVGIEEKVEERHKCEINE